MCTPPRFPQRSFPCCSEPKHGTRLLKSPSGDQWLPQGASPDHHGTEGHGDSQPKEVPPQAQLGHHPSANAGVKARGQQSPRKAGRNGRGHPAGSSTESPIALAPRPWTRGHGLSTLSCCPSTCWKHKLAPPFCTRAPLPTPGQPISWLKGSLGQGELHHQGTQQPVRT